MKKTIVLLSIFLLNTSFITNNKLYNSLSKMYEINKEKCLELAEHQINNNSENYAPYLFALKIELDKYKELRWIKFASMDQTPDWETYKKPIMRMIEYIKKIYTFASEDIMYETNCFQLFGDINKELTALIVGLHQNKEFELKKKLIQKADDFYGIEITAFAPPSSGITYNTSQDSRIKDAYPNTKVNVFLNGEATGKENILSSDEKKELEFLIILNKGRLEKGLNPLILNKDLSRAARYHSYDMGSQNYFKHNSFDRKGGKLVKVCGTFERVRKFTNCGGEIIHGGSSSAEGAYNSFHNSPGHYKIMFGKNYTEVGVGYIKVDGGRLTNYWTVDFK